MIMGELGVRNGTVLKRDLIPSTVILLKRCSQIAKASFQQKMESKTQFSGKELYSWC